MVAAFRREQMDERIDAKKHFTNKWTHKIKSGLVFVDIKGKDHGR